MKISNEKPPIYQKCVDKFGVDFDNGVIFTYGDTVYAKFKLEPDLVVHEGVHVRQQSKMDKDQWWEKYLTDDSFRLFQEIEAYRAQYKFLKENIKDKNHLFRRLHKISQDLSGFIYGNLVSYAEARKLITE